MKSKYGILFITSALLGMTSCGDIVLPTTTTEETDSIVTPAKFFAAVGLNKEFDDILSGASINEELKEYVYSLISQIENSYLNNLSFTFSQVTSDNVNYNYKSSLLICGLGDEDIDLSFSYNINSTVKEQKHNHGTSEDYLEDEDWTSKTDDSYDKDHNDVNWDNFSDKWDDGKHNGKTPNNLFNEFSNIEGIAEIKNTALSFVGNVYQDQQKVKLDVVLSSSESTYLDLRIEKGFNNDRNKVEFDFTFINENEIVLDIGFDLEYNSDKACLVLYVNGSKIKISRVIYSDDIVVYELYLTSNDGTTKKYRFKRVISFNEVMNEETITFIEID